ncbi:MAG: protein-tyrosine phosphatase family protein [Verrucomicrobiales bacterium]
MARKGQPERTEPFTWIVEGVIAASWWPDPYVFDIYEEQNVRAVVNCCEFDNRQDVPSQFSTIHINVPDYGVPTETQIQRFLTSWMSTTRPGEAVVVHCVAGCGRTGSS